MSLQCVQQIKLPPTSMNIRVRQQIANQLSFSDFSSPKRSDRSFLVAHT